MLHDLPGVASPRVLLVGLGEADKLGPAQYLKAVGDAARALKTGAVTHAVFALTDVAMLFLRCRDGISHHPAESITAEDAATGARVLQVFIERFAARR